MSFTFEVLKLRKLFALGGGDDGHDQLLQGAREGSEVGQVLEVAGVVVLATPAHHNGFLGRHLDAEMNNLMTRGFAQSCCSMH